MSLLNLPGWKMLHLTTKAHDYVVEARYEPEPAACPNPDCGATTLYKHGTLRQLAMDVPAHGKRMGIEVVRVRYRCKGCGKTFLQPLPDLDDGGSMTKRLVEYIERQSLERPFLQIASEVGIHERTVRRIFNAYVERLDKSVVFETPEWLGLDEVFLLNRARCVLSNIKAATVIDLLEDRNKPTLHQRLFWMPDKERIRVVTMDMWKPYRDAVRAILPDAQVVVDKFHVVRMASNALEGVRRRLRDSMNTTARRKLMRSRYLILRRRRDLDDEGRATVESWTADLPELAMAYSIKEQFYDLFDLADAGEAFQRYDKLHREIPEEVARDFKPLVTAMTNWREEIGNYFTHRATNAVTEALNGITKVTNRTGRGYSFAAIRAKTIYAKALRQDKGKFHGKRPTRKSGTIAVDMNAVSALRESGVEYADFLEMLRGLGYTTVVLAGNQDVDAE